VGHLNMIGKRFRIDAEAVILGGDFDFSCDQVLDRMIRTAMTKLELKGLRARREGQNLMP
jgi:hypothetical protein